MHDRIVRVTQSCGCLAIEEINGDGAGTRGFCDQAGLIVADVGGHGVSGSDQPWHGSATEDAGCPGHEDPSTHDAAPRSFATRGEE